MVTLTLKPKNDIHFVPNYSQCMTTSPIGYRKRCGNLISRKISPYFYTMLMFLYDVNQINLMNMTKKITVTMVIAIASLFAASGITSYSVFAQPNGENVETGKNNYEEFSNCLTQSEGVKGFASESQIRDCFRPIYDPEADTGTTSSDNADDSDGSSSGSGSDDNSESDN